MGNRFVLLAPDNQFNQGMVPTGRMIVARMALRCGVAHAGMAATRIAHVGRTEVARFRSADIATIASANRMSARDLSDAETNGPPLTSVNVVRKLPDADGPMLLDLSDEDRLALQREYPGARLVPEGNASMAFMSLAIQEVATMSGASAKPPKRLRVRVRDSKSKRPMPHIEVQCILDRSTRPPSGATAHTNAKGIANLVIPGRFKKGDVQVNPRHSFWPSARLAIAFDNESKTIEIECPSIAKSIDCARSLYKDSETDNGRGVVVAVVDGGAGPHKLLHISKGANLVDDESESDLRDNGIGHGTHVAGLIAGQQSKTTLAGFAPGVTLNVYRVYGKNETSTGSFVVAEAIRRAVDDGSDLINLSLTLESDQPEVIREIRRARASGVAIIAAAGNEASKVMFPARLSGVLGVSAMGVLNCAPTGSSVDFECLENPRGSNANHRIARFSCLGPEIDLIAPGVGLISLFPGSRRAIMSGTSMAAPIVTGRIACALAKNVDLLSQDRVQRRSDAINQMALREATNLGFAAKFQGQGLPV
jgi:subtilisin